MIPELGHYALVLALALGLIQAVAPVIGARTNDAALMGLANSTAPMQFAFVGLAFLTLIVCYVTSDFSVATVPEPGFAAALLLGVSGLARRRLREIRPAAGPEYRLP